MDLAWYKDQAMDWATGIQLPAWAITVFLLLATATRPTLGLTPSPIQCVTRLKWSGHEADSSPQSNTEVENAWS